MPPKTVTTGAGTALTTDPAANLPSIIASKEISQSEIEAAEEFGGFAGEGLEDVTAKDILIPRIAIIQALSPQIQRSKSEYMPEAKIGDICDTGMREIIPNPFIVLPIKFQKLWLEWAPRGSETKLVNVHLDNSIMMQTKQDEKTKQFLLQNGNMISETAQFYVLNQACDWRLSYMSFSSTQLKAAQIWLNLATGERLTRRDGTKFVPPLWYRTYQVTTRDQSNAKGSWAGWDISRFEPITAFPAYTEVLDMAKRARNELSEGTIRADIENMKDEVERNSGSRPSDGYDRTIDGERM